MATYLEVEEARKLSGLRLVLSAGVPGPWGEAAKGIFHAKGVLPLKVRQRPGEPNEALRSWTGHDNAPVAVYENEAPRSGWAEILLLAERLAPEPALVPAETEERALLFGYAYELCGEGGFGWVRRLMMLHQVLELDLPIDNPVRVMVTTLGHKYGYRPAAAAMARERAAAILRLFAARLAGQRERGSRYLIGDRLSALDIYWAAFAALLQPLPEDLCAMSAALRAQYTADDPLLRDAAGPHLLEHRDFVYREHLELPVDL